MIWLPSVVAEAVVVVGYDMAASQASAVPSGPSSELTGKLVTSSQLYSTHENVRLELAFVTL